MIIKIQGTENKLPSKELLAYLCVAMKRGCEDKEESQVRGTVLLSC